MAVFHIPVHFAASDSLVEHELEKIVFVVSSSFDIGTVN
jgi:hypothetical protein